MGGLGILRAELYEDAEAVKRLPEQTLDFLRCKSFLAVHRVADKKVACADFLQYASRVFRALYPFIQFPNRRTAPIPH